VVVIGPLEEVLLGNGHVSSVIFHVELVLGL
jgi:hypothetical protein